MAVFRNYKCPKCKKIVEEYEPMDKHLEDHPCPDCGTVMYQLYAKPTIIMGGTESEKLEKLSPKWD